MKNDTLAVWLKGIGMIGGAMCIQYQNALAQWANEGTWPSGVNWHMVIVGTLGAGFLALVTFCSGSFSKWTASRNGNGNNGNTEITTK